MTDDIEITVGPDVCGQITWKPPACILEKLQAGTPTSVDAMNWFRSQLEKYALVLCQAQTSTRGIFWLDEEVHKLLTGVIALSEPEV